MTHTQPLLGPNPREREQQLPLRIARNERMRVVLKRLRAGSGQAWFSYDGRRVPVQLLGSLDDDLLSWQATESVPEGPIKLVFFGPSAGYHAVLESHGQRAGTNVTSLPTHFETLRFRRDPRFPAAESVFLMRPDDALEPPRKLYGMSDRGLSYVVDTADLSVAVGDRFSADVIWMAGLRVRLGLHVRHVSTLVDGQHSVVGASIEPLTQEDLSRWHEQMDAVRHSLTKTGKLFTRDMWELFESAGYFNLSQKNSAEFSSRREAFERASQMLSAHPERGAQFVFPSIRGIEAAASIMAETEQTAFIFHLAKRKGDDPRGIAGNTVLRSVYEHMLSWVTRNDIQWVAGWVQDVTRFSCGLHRDFCLAHSAAGSAGIYTFRALELDAKPMNTLPDGWTVRMALPAEIPEICARFHHDYPHPIPTARAWNEQALCPNRELGRSVPRERLVGVALKDGVIKGATIAEGAMPGLHLFGILDSCYVARFDHEEDGEQAVSALVAFASAWYHARGTSHFVYASDMLSRSVEGARDLGVTHESIFNVDLMGKFLEHLWQMTAEG
ncbi:MAG: hypothetical protein RLZZ450_3423 [Pseudomonadota bacterium]|jgi:hypothetical protein